jgi:SpoVK/Ycf46/Vps4 family AAA+-type ATPase
MPSSDAMTWSEYSRSYLMAALAEIPHPLTPSPLCGEGEPDGAADATSPLPRGEGAGGEVRGGTGGVGPPALEILCTAFGLSPFERGIVLLCAGMELDPGEPLPLAPSPTRGGGTGDDATGGVMLPPPHRGRAGEGVRGGMMGSPTFSLALAVLPEPHWSALAPDAPLRRWRLIEITNQLGVSLLASPLRLDERILHFLVGVQHLDERLTGLIEPVAPAGDLVASHLALAQQIGAIWAHAAGSLPLVQLCGGDEQSKRDIAAAGCASVGLRLHALAADVAPTHAGELEGLIRLWEREAALTTSALYIEAEALDPADARSVATVTRLLERTNGALLLGTRDRWPPLRRATRTFDIPRPTAAEQQQLWQAYLGSAAPGLNGQIGGLVAQFNLSMPAIRAAAQEALSSFTLSPGAPDPSPRGPEGPEYQALGQRLWDASRAQARPRMAALAQRIAPMATWEQLVLPEAERRLLREVAAHVAHRATVYETWGFGAMSSRGLGISALFAGASGTGKTMAAEVLANELRLDLYRIDLASVVSKYIGETEKNLRRVFDAAEDGGAILFFDEADALFGKRSEVKDSHDRYANIEINYLLQRMEAYRGLAVLATNMKGALDPAFLRRIRFAVNFPFPDAASRAAIWQRIFPPQTPTEGLDIARLARLNLAGGNIRNIALNAAFLAAASGEPVRMTHLLHATRSEYAKLERPLSEAEIGGWQ